MYFDHSTKEVAPKPKFPQVGSSQNFDMSKLLL